MSILLHNWKNQPTTAPATKNLKNFEFMEALPHDIDKDLFTHSIHRGKKIPAPAASEAEKQKPKYQHPWFIKKITTQFDAWIELIGMSMWKLLDIHGVQPKTRLGEVDENERYILSQQVPEYKSLEDYPESKGHEGGYLEAVLAHQFTGLGDVAVIALLLNEIDLKDGNLGTTRNGRIVKVDGEWCFARLQRDNQHKYSFDITSEMLDNLPHVDQSSYHADNWLRGKSADVDRSVRSLELRIAEDAAFRTEVNQTILRIMMLPDSLFYQMIHRFIPKTPFSHILYKELLLRRDRLMYAAMLNKSFQAYLGSRDAERHQQAYLNYLLSFKTHKKSKLLGMDPKENDQWKKSIQEQLLRFKKLNKKVQAQRQDFIKLDNITYPLFKLLDLPSFPERSVIITKLKETCEAMHLLAETQNYAKACVAIQTSFVARVKVINTFVNLDNLACSIYALDDGPQESKGMGWAERQQVINRLKSFARVPYERLNGPHSLQFNPKKELTELNDSIKKSLNGEIDQLIAFDELAASFLALEDTPQFPGRQAVVDALKNKVVQFYNSLYRDCDIEKAVLFLPSKDTLTAFIAANNKALPILAMSNDTDLNSNRQKALEKLKQDANDLYEDKADGTLLEEDLSAFQRLSAFEEQLKQSNLVQPALLQIFSPAEYQNIIDYLRTRTQECYVAENMPDACNTLTAFYSYIEQVANTIADSLPPASDPLRATMLPLVQTMIVDAYQHLGVGNELTYLATAIDHLSARHSLIATSENTMADYPNYSHAYQEISELGSQGFQAATFGDFKATYERHEKKFQLFLHLISITTTIEKFREDSRIPASIIDQLMQLTNEAFMAQDIGAAECLAIDRAIANTELWVDRAEWLVSFQLVTPILCPARIAIIHQLKTCALQAAQHISAMSFDELAAPLVGHFQNFQVFDQFAAELLSTTEEPDSPRGKLQQLAVLSYSHPNRPYFVLLRNLFDRIKDPAFEDHDALNLYYSMITIMHSFGEGEEPFTSPERIAELQRMRENLSAVLDENAVLEKDTPAFQYLNCILYTRNILGMPVQGGVHRQNAIVRLQGMVRDYYARTTEPLLDYSPIENAYTPIELLDEKMHLIDQEIQIHPEEAAEEKHCSVDWHDIALSTLKAAVDAQYNQANQDIHPFLAAVNTTLYHTQMLKRLKSSTLPSKQAAIFAVQTLALQACKDPLHHSKTFVSAMDNFNRLIFQENNKASRKKNTPWKATLIDQAFNEAFTAFAQNPTIYKTTNIFQQAIKTQQSPPHVDDFTNLFKRAIGSSPPSPSTPTSPSSVTDSENKFRRHPFQLQLIL